MNLIFIVILALIVFALQKLSAKHSAENILYEFSLSKNIVEPEETFQLISILKNRRKSPVLFLRLSEPVPSTISVQAEGSGSTLHVHDHFGADSELCLDQTLHLMPRQKLTRILDASISKRGTYRFDHVFLQTGDVLGFEEYESCFQRNQEIVVLPKRADLSEFENAYANWYGDISVRRFILPDPILTIGFHEYSGREPMKDISWPRSLKSDCLMVKEFDHTSEPAATVILNIGGASTELAEQCFSTMRSVCEKLETSSINYSVVSNVSTPSGISSLLALPDGVGHQHLQDVLEGLGRASASPFWSFQYLLDKSINLEEANRGYILVSPELSLEAAAHLRRFESRTGQRVLQITVKGGETS